jgi:hypothetical protein
MVLYEIYAATHYCMIRKAGAFKLGKKAFLRSFSIEVPRKETEIVTFCVGENQTNVIKD